MASQGYRDWLRAGRPYALIRPAAAVQATLRGYGLTVYDYPNDAHLLAATPEDHTPFSVTGWPSTNKRWKARGLDVMPRGDTAADRAENAAIARQLIRDRDAGTPGTMWIKYLNWTDERGVCRQERWTDATRPLYRDTRTSTDDGHIHISGRSDADDDARADDYNPIARMAGPNGGDGDLTPLESAKLDAIYNAKRTTKLPGNNEAVFEVPLTAKLDDIGAKVDALTAKVGAPVDGGVLEAEPLDLDALADKVAARLGDSFADKVADKLAARLAS